MRINIYNEELTKETQIVSKTVTEGPNQGKTFYGCRIVLASAPDLHHTDGDDDRSGVTFWFGDKDTCERMADAMAGVLRRIVR